MQQMIYDCKAVEVFVLAVTQRAKWTLFEVRARPGGHVSVV